MLAELKALGGSAGVAELDAAVIKRLISENLLEVPPDQRDEILERLRPKLTWARTILKNSGLVNNVRQGEWALLNPQLDLRSVNADQIWQEHRNKYKREEGDMAADAEIGLSAEDFEVLERNQKSRRWPELPKSDQQSINALRKKLLNIALYLKDSLRSEVGLQEFVSMPNPSGSNSLYYWSCVYPTDAQNKTFGFQLFVIVKPQTIEFGFGAGSGNAEMKNKDKLENLKRILADARTRLKALRNAPWLASLARDAQSAGFRLRPKWLRDGGDKEGFATAAEWVDHAASEQGAGAAISRFLTRREVLDLGDRLADVLREELQRFVPIIEGIYLGSSAADTTARATTTPSTGLPSLTLDWLVEQTLWPKDRLAEIVDTVETGSRQIVLAGPPGTSKTWVARLLARFLTQDRQGAVRMVQFHPSYSYEEFIEGLRPIARGGSISFERRDGFVLSVVDAMRTTNPGRTVIVIDEMNRANLPKVFGELMYLFEYRDEPLDLQYSQGFKLPSDLFFLGTMNTADRSIRSIDLALRRRFDVFDCPPDSDVLSGFYDRGAINEVADLIDGFEKLNGELTKTLDVHHTIGHAFFMVNEMTTDRLLRIWRHKIGPLINEYFFDLPDVAASYVPARFWPSLE